MGKFKMPKISLRKGLSKLYSKTGGKSTDVMMWVGTGFVLGGTVLACKKTIELPGIIAEYKTEKSRLEAAPHEDKEIRELKWKTAGKVAKLYAVPALMEGVGLVDMHCANQTLKIVNTELTGTVAVLSTAIEKIRAGIREEGGEELEDKIMHGGYEEKEVVKVDESGEEHVETVKVYKRNGMPSPYARWFCYGEADGAEESPEYNRQFLRNQQNLLPGYLRANRKVMLNDVYRMLGIRESVAGNRVGWIYDPKDPQGDNRIDLRIQEVYREKEGCPGEWETVFLIDPNVDGEVEAKAVRMGLMDE